MKRSISCITTTEITTANAQTTKICRPNPSALISPPPSATTPYVHNLPETGLNILIVDDNPINLRILEKGLNIMFKNIKRLEEASNGNDALKLLHLYKFDIILLDIDMPVLNGVDTTKKIRKSCCLNSSIPIIAITTNDSVESKENYMKIGMVLTKFDVCNLYVNNLFYILE